MQSQKELTTNRVLGFSTGKRSVGFPADKAAAQSKPAATPPPGSSPATKAAARSLAAPGAPTPKRPKGRWFISSVILSICVAVVGGLFNEFFRFQAYGVIDGRVIRISAPWAGVISSIQARDGELVEQGQLLATLQNSELKMRLAEVRGRIQIAQASLATRLAELSAMSRQQSERSMRIHVDYFELLGSLYQEESRLDELRSERQRQHYLNRNKVSSKQDFESADRAYSGQKARIGELRRAVAEMKDGMSDSDLPNDQRQLLAVENAKLESLISEWNRLTEYESLGEIRAPVSGRIVRRHQFSGEFASESSVIFDIMEEGSMRAVIYTEQHRARDFKPGDSVWVNMPPYRSNVEFVVERFGDKMATPPNNLRQYYRRDEHLVLLYARPRMPQLGDTQGDNSIWLGAEVRLPRFRLPRISVPQW